MASQRTIFPSQGAVAFGLSLLFVTAAAAHRTASADSCGVAISCAPIPGRASHTFRAWRVGAGGVPYASWTPSETERCGHGLWRERAVAVEDGIGGRIHAWIEAGNPAAPAWAIRRDSSGVVVSGWPANGAALSPVTGARLGLVMCEDGAGGALVAWEEHGAGALPRIRVQRVSASGAIESGWPAGGMEVAGAVGAESAPAIVSDGLGGAIVTWQVARASGPEVRVMRMTGAGTPAAGWPNGGRTVCAHDSAQRAPVVMRDGLGGAFVAWEDGRQGRLQIYLTRIESNGAVAGGWSSDGLAIASGSGAQRFARVAEDGGDGVYVIWQDERSGAAQTYAQRVSLFGSVWTGWPAGGLAVAPNAGEQQEATGQWDGATGTYVAWTDFRADGDGDIYLQRLDGHGKTFEEWPAGGVAVCAASGEQAQAALADASSGGVTVAWWAGEPPAVTGVDERARAPERLAIQWVGKPGGLWVRLGLKSGARARLEVLDVAGRVMARRDVTGLDAGWHVVSLESGHRMAPGLYFVRARQAGETAVTRAIVLR